MVDIPRRIFPSFDESDLMVPAWKDIRPVLDAVRPGFPAAEAQAVLDHPELQDALVADLERLAAEPTAARQGMLHIVGMWLLAEKRDRRLASPLMKLAGGDAEALDAIWGDWLTEGWGRAAASVCSSDELKAFIEDAGHDEWARAMACNALTIQVYEGDLDRRATVEYAIALQEAYLAQHRDNPEDGSNDLLHDYLCDIVGDLGDCTDFHHVERWSAQGILDPGHAGIGWYRREFDTPYAERRDKEMQRDKLYVRNALAALAGAYCYSVQFHAKGKGARAGAPAEDAAVWAAADGSYCREAPKVGRNDPCPCGSGKKYKKCCGAG